MCGDGFQFDSEACIVYGDDAVGLRCAGSSDGVRNACSSPCRVAICCVFVYIFVR
jgi:hypothetical protein